MGTPRFAVNLDGSGMLYTTGNTGPKRSLSNLFKSRSRSGRNAKQRHLVPSNHDSISLLTPFVVWGGLICVLYAVGGSGVCMVRQTGFLAVTFAAGAHGV